MAAAALARRTVAGVGAGLWALLGLLSAIGPVDLGWTELLFLLAPMVLVPLALDRARVLLEPSLAARWLGRVLDAAPLAAWFAAASFFNPPGLAGAALAGVWLLLCLAAAAAGLLGLWTLLVRECSLKAEATTACTALLFLAVGGGWLVVSRAGLATGFAEPIPMLTAVHFHYAGFLTLTLAACAIGSFAAEDASLAARLARLAAFGAILGVPTIAAGFVLSLALKLAGVLVLSVSVATLCLVQVGLLGRMGRPLASNLLAVSSAAGIAGMLLAVAYGLGELGGASALAIPTMAALHGSLNGLGFALCGLLAWASRPPAVEPEPGIAETAPQPEGEPAPRYRLAAIIVALALAVLVYRALVHGHLEQTAALFVGLPALLAAAVAATPRARTSTGTVMKAMTIGLLLSGMFLGEGFICIVMAAPIFYVVGFAVGMVLDARRRRREVRLPLLTLALIVPASFEGVTDSLSFPRAGQVQVERVVAAPPAEVERALASPPRLDRPLPWFLRLGFPLPIEASGGGLTPGSLFRVRFAGGEGVPGDLTLVVAEAAPGRVRFEALDDTSHIAHWLGWRGAEVTFAPAEGGGTKVSWTLSYERRLDPGWYFGPLERHAVGLAAWYLIDASATP